MSSLTRSLPQPNFAPWPRKRTLFWAVGICTVTGGLSFSSRVSRRVLPTVPGWREARANTHTVTSDTEYTQNHFSCYKECPSMSSALKPSLALKTTLRSLPWSLEFKVLSLALRAPWEQRPCLIILWVPYRNEQRALHGRRHSNNLLTCFMLA